MLTEKVEGDYAHKFLVRSIKAGFRSEMPAFLLKTTLFEKIPALPPTCRRAGQVLQSLPFKAFFAMVLSIMSYTIPKPKNRRRKKKFGFLVRSRTSGGRRTLRNRRRKGRARLAA